MKRTLEWLGGLVLFAVAVLAGGPAQAAEPVLIGDTTLRMFVTANPADPNLFMQPSTNLPSRAYQVWTLKIDEKTGQGLILNEATGGCLAVYRVVIGDRRPVIQRPCDGQLTEVWTVNQKNDGTTYFVNAYSGSCMGYEPIYVGQYSQLLEFPCRGADHELFRFKPAS
jgi:Ricin-type beta-trefoil lectin domain-like